MAEGAAINTPIQGSAAEIIKLAMIDVEHLLREKKMQSRMILTVHDELVFDALKEEEDELCEICLLYTSPSPRDLSTSRMPSSA